MKFYNFIGSAVLTFLLVAFLAIPQEIFAIEFNFFDFNGEDNYQVLSEFESKKILQDFPDILYGKWVELKVSGYSNLKEETAISLLKQISMLSMWNYLFKDIPLDVSIGVAREGLDIARLIGTEDTSGIIGKLEKGSVNIAINYLKDYFSKNQIKVSFGAMEMKYKTEFEDVDNPLQYIIMYKRIDDKRSKVVARMYSPKEITPPASRGSIGGVYGFSSSLSHGEKISPFIVEINGIMEDGLFGSYSWDKKNTTIKTIFPETVPDFGLKPKSWLQKYITDPIKNAIDSFSGIFSFLNISKDNITEYIFKDTTDQEAIDEEVKSISSEDSLEKDYPIEKIDDKTVKQEEVIKEVVKEEGVKKEVEKKIEEKVVPVFCSKSSQSVSSYNIVINEVAWMGTENSANDEWIELKNVSNADINLKGWLLRDKEDQINVVFEDYTVPRGGFLLLERTDDNTVPFKTADLIYKGSLSNSEEELYLFDSLCQLKDFVSGSPKWPAGDSTTRKTMERDEDLIGWHTYSAGGSNNIWGTPRENNSIKKEAMASIAVSASKSTSTVTYGGGYSAPTYCSQSNSSASNTSKVIINEVAWMGTENSANDEWIELKNVSDESVNLANWQLLDAENIKVIFDSLDVIDPQGFYLLERTDDDSVPNIIMNKSYVGGLSNSGESLRLFDANCQLMDEVLAAPDWPAGDNTLRKTMERSADLLSWHTYYSDSVDNLSGLWGSPKAENSIETIPDDEKNEPIDNSNHLLITEVKTGDDGGTEYIELYNQTENQIELCPSEESCYYLSYYSPTSPWYDPYRNWKFPSGAVINSNSYYVIDIFGNSDDSMIGTGADWKVKTIEGNDYESGQLGNSAGSLSIFSNNPKYIKAEDEVDLTEEEKNNRAVGFKIDVVAWKSGEETLTVKEGDVFNISETGKAIGRKWSNQKYIDTDNNSNDLQLEESSLRNHSPKPPAKVQNLLATAGESQRNSVILSWTAALDEDTPYQDLTYDIYYSRNGQIDDNNLKNITDYVDIAITSGENNKMSAIIKDLFYDSEYYFKVRVKDKEDNISPLSESTSFLISAANHQKEAPYYDFKRSGHSQYSGPVGIDLAYDTIIEGNQDNPPSNDFTSVSVIDENGTVYFWGSDNSSYDFYAFDSAQKKWSIHCTEACGYYPSLSKDGTIYLSSDHYIYAVSPSGKIMWEKEYSSILTKSTIIDSKGNIYFLADKEGSVSALFSIDGDGRERKLYDPQEILNGSNPSSFTELVIDDSDNVYFALNDFVIKYNNGSVSREQILPKREASCPDSLEIIASIAKVNISFSGSVLLNVNNGRCVKADEILPVLYSLSNDFSEVIWSKNDYAGPIGFNEEEFYYTRLEIGTYPMIIYLGAANVSTGEMKWERRFTGVNFVVSDSANRIYFVNNSNVLGYDSSDMPENLEDGAFHLSPGYYYGDVVSIGSDRFYFSNLQRVYSVNISQ